MKPFIMLCTALVGVSLASCRAKQTELNAYEQDSISLWQWDDIVLIHERLDSLEHKPTERTLIFRQRGQAVQAVHQQTIQQKEVKPAPVKRISRWWWLALGAVFALAVVFAILSAKGYLLKRLMLV